MLEHQHQHQHQTQKLMGTVERVTFHNPENGWAVLKVKAYGHFFKDDLVTVLVNQGHVFAGATFDFEGSWVNHPKFGDQFKAIKQTEKRPASTAALEKYLGSGLIFGVGPKTAKRIVRHFKEETLDVFENKIELLKNVEGIAEKKLKQIKDAWIEHREIRNVMMFLQDHGISTLFAVKIFKKYGNKSIEIVQKNPYQLAKDFYGIGFFSADKVALSLGIERDSKIRMMAGIKHVLSSARDEGHVFLYFNQIQEGLKELLDFDIDPLYLNELLLILQDEKEIFIKEIRGENTYYSRSLYFDELMSSKKIKKLLAQEIKIDEVRVNEWIKRYTEKNGVQLSEGQRSSIIDVISNKVSILTGGPGCGKTTTTNVIVKLSMAMGKKVLLAAPTGRAAQRMTEVIGIESKTIHRLLIFDPSKGGFKKGEEDPLDADFLIVDECSMLDISLFNSFLKAVPVTAQLLLVGDSDQLPSVGPGNVFRNLIESKVVKVAHLKEIFRQAKESLIITYAHDINNGIIPKIDSPLRNIRNWKHLDCHFIDSDEMTKEQIKFVLKAKNHYLKIKEQDSSLTDNEDKKEVDELIIPDKFQHVVIEDLIRREGESEELIALLKRVPKYSTLNYGLTAKSMILKLLLEVIPKYYKSNTEVQILSPMTKGSLGTHNLNQLVQGAVNPPREGKTEIFISGKKFRVGDRVIQKRNNYNLGVFNGDIGIIKEINPIDSECVIHFDFKTESPRVVHYKNDNFIELDLAYAITIHKSQGSEFDIVIIPILTQHFKMLFRNLIYTGLTRAKKNAILIGQRKALVMAIKNIDISNRQTGLVEFLNEEN